MPTKPGDFNNDYNNDFSHVQQVTALPPQAQQRVPGLEWQIFDQDPTIKVGWR